MKTTDETKKGLECCVDVNAICLGNCVHADNDEVVFPDCIRLLMIDALGLIEQLEAQNAEQAEKIRQLEAERDAAVADILYAASVYLGECETCKNGEVCAACKRQDACDECKNSKCMCSSCGAGRSNWQWRGVQKEE